MIGILLVFPLNLGLVEALQFFDTQSGILLRPSSFNNASGFGFAMAYLPSKSPSLIVGAPYETLQGEMYQCPLYKAGGKITNATKELHCSRISIDIYSVINSSEKLTRNLFLGAAISTISNVFMTCAPHWADTDKKVPIGACLLSNVSHHRDVGLYKHIKDNFRSIKERLGGIGWSMFTDSYNNITLVPKSTPDSENIITINNNEVTQQGIIKKIWSENKMNKARFTKMRNVGYAVSAGRYFPAKYNYAVSQTDKSMRGQITFLKYLNSEPGLVFESGENKNLLYDHSVGSMYGSALFSIDINIDGLTDLLIGAPTYAIENGFENGAVHIFLGGPLANLTTNKRRTRSIYSKINGARFGSAISSIDLDHDGYPELIISAPYSEDTGIVYIISGNEVNEVLFSQKSKASVALSHFKSIQHISNIKYKGFGYSLQVIPDLDSNGCDELAVGSPESGHVLLYPCISRVNITISAKLKGARNFVLEDENSFTVEICLNVSDNFNKKTKLLDLTITNKIIPDAQIDKNNASFDIRISLQKEGSICRDILVYLSDSESGLFNFTTEAKLKQLDLSQDNKVNGTFCENRSGPVILNGTTKLSLGIVRRCEGEGCLPRFNTSLTWSAGSPYILGSSREESLTLRVSNDGHKSYDSCAKVKIEGVQILRIGCQHQDDLYECFLPSPMIKPSQDPFSKKIDLNMTRLTNFNESIIANIAVYSPCNAKYFSANNTLAVPLTLNTDQIVLKGTIQNRNLTLKELESNDIILIVNFITIIINGSISWNSLLISPFVEGFNSSFVSKISMDCRHLTVDLLTYRSCELDELQGYSSININFYIELDKVKLRSIFEGKVRVLTTELLLNVSLTPTTVVKQIRLLSNISLLQEDLNIAQNQSLIIWISVVIAIIGLAVIIFILVKINFFKRKEKEKLEELKDNIRRKSQVSENVTETLGNLENDLELKELRKRKFSNIETISEENLVD